MVLTLHRPKLAASRTVSHRLSCSTGPGTESAPIVLSGGFGAAFTSQFVDIAVIK
jgi:hypothetical protein